MKLVKYSYKKSNCDTWLLSGQEFFDDYSIEKWQGYILNGTEFFRSLGGTEINKGFNHVSISPDKQQKSIYNLQGDISDFIVSYLNSDLHSFNNELVSYILDLIDDNDYSISELYYKIDPNDNYKIQLDGIINNILELIDPIASDGYYTIHDIIHDIDDKILINTFGEWHVCNIDYNISNSFMISNDRYYLNDFIKV